MGLFDIFKKKTVSEKPTKVIIENNILNSNVPATYFDSLTSNDKIFKLLWFADGKFKNYDPEQDTDILFENELFRITFSFSMEPSLLSFKLRVKQSSSIDVNESVGYYPSYENLSSEQRWVYLNWLGDVRKQVDIGYVFIFYYGLERHLLYSNYKDAVDVILLLRKYHKNSSFQGYSLSALLLAAILHKDEDTLERSLVSCDGDYPGNLVLIAKYLMKKDITPDEIVAMASSVGFKNKRYINQYPDMFKEVLSLKLENEFGTGTYPIYALDADFEFKDELVFANMSLPSNTRSPILPSIIDNLQFKDSIMQLLSSTHNELKEKLAQIRKEGIKPVPQVSENKNVGYEISYDLICPYCDMKLDKPPKRKKKCSHCDNYIYVRSSRILFPSTCLTEDEALATSEFYSLKEHGIEKDDFFQKHEQMGKKQYVSTCIGMYKDLLLEKTDLFELKSINFKLALLHYKLGNEFISYLQHSAKMELMDLKQKGYKKVKISSVGSCDTCKKLNGRVLTIEETLKEKPVPCIDCTHEMEKGKPGWCMCSYQPVLQEHI
ncbi:TerB N-terminal domain-containing protein [Methanolobus sp. ZRKC5]|uniref:TerB N-terminal domain-containing protein n=1 Tax=unclassified Methanolobus TaxID=2629569 RepID=UPI00313A8919